MKFKTDKIADIGTAELEEFDLILLEKGTSKTIFTNEYSYILYTVENRFGWIEEVVEEFANKGFSEKFINIFVSACEQGIRYIRFDCDGSKIL